MAQDASVQQLIGNVLFSDGAAAAIIGRPSSKCMLCFRVILV
jgi:predicted naringenin-chalcone synthase